MGLITQLFGYPLGWVMWLCYTIFRNYGFALILFTLITKAILFPLSIKQQKNLAKQQLLQPKLEKLQKQYGKNRERYQQEMQKLYMEEGFSPFSGCLPLLIQFPILFGLIDVVYRPLTHIVRMSGELIESARKITESLNMLVVSTPEISIVQAVNQHPDKFSGLGQDFINQIQGLDLTFFGLNLGQVPQFAWSILVIIPILSGLTSLGVSLVSMKMNRSGNSAPGMMKGMMLIMPIFSAWFAFQVPMGVGLYWIFSNIFAGLQTVLLYKIYTPERVKALAEKEALKKKGKKKKPSRMQEMMMNSGNPPAKEKPQLSAEEIKKQKEIDRRRLAEARKRNAEKYGETYVEVEDKDLE